jgi:hypothetical protein
MRSGEKYFDTVSCVVLDFMRWEHEVLEPPQPVRVYTDVPLGCAVPQHVMKHRLAIGRLLCGALGCA